MGFEKTAPHGGNIYNFAKKHGYHEQEVIDFSANINPLKYPAGLKEEIINSFENIKHYPDPDCTELKAMAAELYQTHWENIIAGNGAVDLIYTIVQRLRPKKVLIVQPTFSEYEKACKTIGVEPDNLILKGDDDWQLSLQEIGSVLNSYEMLFLCNPNNPTGNTHPIETIKELYRQCKKNKVVLVLDESFLDFTREEDRNTALNLFKQDDDNLIILKSLTKMFSIPGLRLGVAVANSNLVKRLEEFRPPWHINYFAQRAGVYCLSNSRVVAETRSFIEKEKQFVYDGLKKITGFKPFKPSANFILVDVRVSGHSAHTVATSLANYRIMARVCDNFIGLDDNFLRFAVKKREENNKLLTALNEVINSGIK
ncbi:threonine-phosphate decarboxylase [Desulfitispora alkaliphila]|uniref:threonine-phosphate decarboxylase CobD n=1 Tax=Desulfitispora alkaliphila TaxID=622674 RepID=UPI003D1E7601